MPAGHPSLASVTAASEEWTWLPRLSADEWKSWALLAADAAFLGACVLGAMYPDWVKRNILNRIKGAPVAAQAPKTGAEGEETKTDAKAQAEGEKSG